MPIALDIPISAIPTVADVVQLLPVAREIIAHITKQDGKKIEDARFVKVVHNGKVIHENATTTGPTRAAAFKDEKPMGPLMIQGDHGPVAYRNVRIKPIKLK